MEMLRFQIDQDLRDPQACLLFLVRTVISHDNGIGLI